MATNTVDPKVTRVKISANLSREVFEMLKRLSEEQGVSMTEILRRALGTENFLRGEVSKGSKILLKDSKGGLKEIVLR